MPRLKVSDPPFSRMRRLLLGYELDGPRMGEAIGASPKTGKSRLDHPGDLTLEELRRICRHCGIPADEIREAITF